MAVPALVVHPRQGISVLLTLRLVRAAGALVVLHPGYELRGGILREVVAQSLPEYSCLRAVRDDLVAVPGYCAEVPEKSFQRHFVTPVMR